MNNFCVEMYEHLSKTWMIKNINDLDLSSLTNDKNKREYN